ncbi:MAG: carbamate kinase [Thermodesulfobacteriota bacterium]
MIIISLGGNAIIRRGEQGTVSEQFRNAALAMGYVAALVKSGVPVIITHGNGPVVGNLVIQNEAAKDIVPPMPLYISDADSEGGLGFMIQQTLYNELRRIGSDVEVATIVTQVVVDPGDPAFRDSTKPIGPFYNKDEAREISASTDWIIKEVASGDFRRVVASPRPKKIIEAGIIKKLAESGTVVIAAGGGGVPVTEASDGTLSGIDCVIDKDYATGALALTVSAEVFINLTSVDMVYTDFGKPTEEGIRELTVSEARSLFAKGHFPPGSMGPKIEAAIEFLEKGGKRVIITSPEFIEEAFSGKAGTVITP